jgi:hypothetical protein
MCCLMTKTVVVTLAVLMLPEGLLSMVDDNGPNGYVSLRHRAQAEYAERLFPDFKSTFYSEIPFWSAASKTVVLYGDVNIGKRDTIGSGGFSNITSNNYPLVYPNPVDSSGKVRISAEYASVEGITGVHVEIRGPNLGSAKASLTPPPIGSLSLSLESGSIHDGVWSGSYTFPNHLPDGNYIYSVVTKDTSGNTTNYGPFSGIVLDRYTKDNVVSPDTKIVYAIDGNGKHIPINGTTPSSDITFVFNGSDRTGVVLEFQCNIDDTIVPMGHENTLDRSLPTTTYAPCFLPNTIAPTMTGNHTYTNLGIGNHTFKVRLMNNEYNLDSSPAAFDWTVTP